jgi:hypothetical protein
MQWARMLDFVLPSLYFRNIAPSLHISPFSFAKQSWGVAVDLSDNSLAQPADSGFSSLLISDVDTPVEGFVVPTTPIVKQRKKRAPRSTVPVVVPEERRFTRSCLKDGFRPKPVLGVQPKPKKR